MSPISESFSRLQRESHPKAIFFVYKQVRRLQCWRQQTFPPRKFTHVAALRIIPPSTEAFYRCIKPHPPNTEKNAGRTKMSCLKLYLIVLPLNPKVTYAPGISLLSERPVSLALKLPLGTVNSPLNHTGFSLP